MELEIMPYKLSVCKTEDISAIDTGKDFFFLARTDEELSLVCRTEDVPEDTISRSDGWRAFRICGILDFSLTGILAGISKVLADKKIGIFAVSTYNTDYILVSDNDLDRATAALKEAGYRIRGQ